MWLFICSMAYFIWYVGIGVGILIVGAVVVHLWSAGNYTDAVLCAIVMVAALYVWNKGITGSIGS